MSVQHCLSFVLEQFSGTHDFTSDDIKIALFDSNASFDADTTTYTTTNEVSSGGGYTTGGALLVLASGYPKMEGSVASVRFTVPAAAWTFTSVKTVRWGLMYNASKANRAILSIDLGSAVQAIGDFSLTFPLALDPVLQIRTTA